MKHHIPLGSETDASVDVVEPGTCDQAFSPCGGNLNGTWAVDRYCDVTNEFPNLCSSAVTTTAVAGAETLAFDTSSVVSTKMESLSYATDASPCLGGSGGETCASIAQQLPSQSCAPTAASGCVCTSSDSVNATATYSYSASGGVLVLWQPPNTISMPDVIAEYCVTGDVLMVRVGVETTFGLERYLRQ